MRTKLGIAGLVLGLAAWPTMVGASGDVGCGPKWTLVAPTLDCASRIVIGPGNDTRVNLLLLLRDRAGLDGQGAAYPEPEWLASYYGHIFTDWDVLPEAFYPSPAAQRVGDTYPEPPEFQGSRCQSVETGGAQFLAAADRNRRIGARDRELLGEGRAALLRLCQATSGYSRYDEAGEAPASLGELDLPRTFASPEAREFGAYLAGAAAFYLGDWRAARERFAALRTAKDEWVRETALYMAARSELGSAAATAMDEWGEFDRAQGDRREAERAARMLEAYLEAYPRGRYADSATGLGRRAHWLAGAVEAQGRAYARMLAAVDPAQPATARLIGEIDDKFLFEDGAAGAIEGPWLLAVHDLLRMRNAPADDEWWAYGTHDLPRLTAAELAGQEAAFAGHGELYEFLKANFAFYVDKDYRAVLRLLPDDARQPAYDPLAFSRQVLRGMALAELGDRNEAGFWQELLGGAKGLHQRPTVELGLALNWERSGEVAKVFAPGSPIEDQLIRDILLENSAGPEVLREVAQATARPQRERDLAAYVLLYKQLSRASYGQFVQDLALVRAGAPTASYSEETYEELVPVGLFVRGTFSDGYACPALRQTAATLARNPRDVKARLCLGDFYRLNGFDYLDRDGTPGKGELGSFAAYPGKEIARSQFYADIIAAPGVAREDRAYALFRAIHCYAPSGYSDCGGEEVPEAQRAAWFRRLKGEFANTRWGREAEYYW